MSHQRMVVKRRASRPHGPGHADLVYSAALRIVG